MPLECSHSPQGKHCFCMPADKQYLIQDVIYEKCCWCGVERGVKENRYPRAGHGPYAYDMKKKRSQDKR